MLGPTTRSWESFDFLGAHRAETCVRPDCRGSLPGGDSGWRRRFRVSPPFRREAGRCCRQGEPAVPTRFQCGRCEPRGDFTQVSTATNPDPGRPLIRETTLRHFRAPRRNQLRRRRLHSPAGSCLRPWKSGRNRKLRNGVRDGSRRIRSLGFRTNQRLGRVTDWTCRSSLVGRVFGTSGMLNALRTRERHQCTGSTSRPRGLFRTGGLCRRAEE